MDEITRRRITKDILALGITIVINSIMTTLCVAGDWLYGMVVFGLGLCPVFGGVFRSLVAWRKDLKFIIPGMIILDLFVFVPLISLTNDWIASTYMEGLYYGLIVSAIMGSTGIITALIRYGVERSKERRMGKINANTAHKVLI